MIFAAVSLLLIFLHGLLKMIADIDESVIWQGYKKFPIRKFVICVLETFLAPSIMFEPIGTGVPAAEGA